MFPNDALSPVPPDVASLVPFLPGGADPSFGYGRLAVLGGCGDLGCALFYAEITRITAVPEPGVATLLGVGVVALAGLRRFRRGGSPQ